MDAAGNALDNICGKMELALAGTANEVVCCSNSANAQMYCATTGAVATNLGIQGTADGNCDRSHAGTFCKADGEFL